MTKKQKSKWFNLQYKICLLNAYFDKGMSLTKYIKYLLFITGLASDGTKFWIITAIGAVYLASNFLLGWLWYKYNWIYAQNEVTNRFNWLAQEIRKFHRKRKV